MQAYEGYFENGRFYIKGDTAHIKGWRKVIITILDESVRTNTADEDKPMKKPFAETRRIFKGKIRMSDDFDELLEEMNEYM